ncbi:MAG: hypothetical protein ACYDCC_05080 [Actinomycetota bacterium]
MSAPLPPLPPSSLPPPGSGGSRSRRVSSAFIVLVGLLAVSLIASVTLGVRLSRANHKLLSKPQGAPTLSSSPTPLAPSSSNLSFGSTLLDQIAHDVERLRGLTFKSGVTPEVLSPQALGQRIADQFARDHTRSSVETTAKVLRTLGLLSPTDDLYNILLKVNTEQIGGYYDHATKKLVVEGSTQNLTPYEQVLTAHELTHAVTDQYFDLGRLDKLSKAGKDDAQTAFLSLAEGDATLMMSLFRDQILTPDQQKEVDQEAARQSSSALDAAPPVIRQTLLFPYEQGLKFVAQLYQHGGTSAIDDAYRNPPVSTEQIMQPDKYFSHDMPMNVTMPNIQGALGSGWTTFDSGDMGELDMSTLASQYLVASDAEAATTDWGGGRYQAFQSSKGVLVAVSTLWDSEDQARTCADKFSDWMKPRFADQGSPFTDGNTNGWQASSGVAEVSWSHNAVSIVIGPDRDSVDRARKSFGF